MFFNYLEKLASDGEARNRLVSGLCWFIAGYTIASLIGIAVMAFT